MPAGPVSAAAHAGGAAGVTAGPDTGPGPRVADIRATAAVKSPPPEPALVASWSRPRPGVNGADPARTGTPGRAPGGRVRLAPLAFPHV